MTDVSTSTICRHKIEWWYDGYSGELPELEENHIKSELCEGNWCGELVFATETEEYFGWWQIAAQR